MSWHIYALLDSQGEVRYIGKSSDVEGRLRDHWKFRFVENTHKSSWLRTLSNPPSFRILDSGTDTCWQDAERFWIAFYRDEVGAKLTNGTDGGDGGFGREPGFRQSTSTISKISASMAGNRNGVNNVMSDECRAKLAQYQTPEWIRKIHTGRKRTDRTMSRISSSLLGHTLGTKHTDEHKLKISESLLLFNDMRRMGLR